MNPAAAATYGAKINTTIDSQTTNILTLQPNNSIISGATATQPSCW